MGEWEEGETQGHNPSIGQYKIRSKSTQQFSTKNVPLAVRVQAQQCTKFVSSESIQMKGPMVGKPRHSQPVTDQANKTKYRKELPM